MKRDDITPELIRELLDYDPETGTLTWRERPGNPQFNGRYAGKPAFTAKHSHGYSVGNIFNHTFYAHRVAYAHHHGKWPDVVDHEEHAKRENQISNLKNTTHQDNCKNVPIQKNNSSGVTGVHFDRQTGKWRASIKVNRKNICLGRHADKQDAIDARKQAERKHGFHRNHGRAA